MELTLHHVGCLVEDIAAAVKAYGGTSPGAGASEPVIEVGQKVRVSFLPTGNGTFIELVEPMPDNAFLLRLLRRGTSYYHAGYFCADLEGCAQKLVAAGAHELTRFRSEALGGRQCVFLMTAAQQMIELIEAK